MLTVGPLNPGKSTNFQLLLASEGGRARGQPGGEGLEAGSGGGRRHFAPAGGEGGRRRHLCTQVSQILRTTFTP